MITKELLLSFREDFKKSVVELEKTYNIKISLGGIRYSAEEFHTKMEVISTDAKHKIIDESKLGYGSDAPKIGTSFKFKTHRFTVSGYNLKRWKKPVELTRDDGKQMISTVEFVKSMIK